VNVRRLTSSLLCALLLATGFEAVIAPAAKAAIVSSGLILNLDAGNSSSYPGSGSSWSDLSGNGLNVTLNNATYSSNNGGYISFNGTSTYGQITSIPSSISFSSGFSATFYANFGGNSQSWERLIDFGNGQSNNNILIARAGTSDTLWFEIYGPSGSSISSCSASNAIRDNAWAWYAISTTATTCSIYVNADTQTASTTPTVAANAITRTSNYIGRSNWSSDGYFDSGIGKLALYNRGLTAAEISQNYKNQIPSCTETPTYSGNTGTISFQTRGPCNWTVPQGVTSANYLIVGGGGGGGGGYNKSWFTGGGGGGGGEVISGSSSLTPGDIHPIAIGGGGSGGAGETSPSAGAVGETTSVLTLSKFARPGQPGIGGKNSSNCGDAGNGGNSGNGNLGGSQNCEAGGSGAGSSAAGGLSYDIGNQGSCGGQGGAGTSSSITGTSIPYGAGGGGGGDSSVGVVTSPNCPRGGTGGYGGSAYLTAYAGGNGSQALYTGCTTSVTCTFSSNAVATDGVTFGSGGGGGSYVGSSGTLGDTTGSISSAGGAGKGGVVIFSWTIPSGSVTSITFSGSIKKLTPVTITAYVTYSGLVNFYTNGRPINHCQGIATTGTSPNIQALCNWLPLTHGSQYVTATLRSSNGSFTAGTNFTGGVTTKRTTSR
jgi:Concanavalin A-like lectin/glucanases superfamily